MKKSINLEAKEIAAGIKIDYRIEYMAKAPAYITLKDQKNNLPNSLSLSFNKPMQKRNQKGQ